MKFWEMIMDKLSDCDASIHVHKDGDKGYPEPLLPASEVRSPFIVEVLISPPGGDGFVSQIGLEHGFDHEPTDTDKNGVVLDLLRALAREMDSNERPDRD